MSELTRRAQELTDRAQAGPWFLLVSTADDRFAAVYGSTVEHVADYVMERDAEFIAWCRSGVPALLDRLTAAETENAKLRAELKRADDWNWGEPR